MEKDKKENSISENDVQEVWSFMQFAQSMMQPLYPGYITPELLNERMKSINLNLRVPNEEDLSKALSSPNESEIILEQFGDWFEVNIQLYKRLISFLSNLMAWDLTYTCKNANYADYSKPAYKKDLQVLSEFLDSFDYKGEFRQVVSQLLRKDAAFYCPRYTEDNLILQELPSEYCRIDGRWSNGFLFSFNMMWFMQAGVDIDLYPDFFKDKYLEMQIGNAGSKGYYVPGNPSNRGSFYAYWVDVPVEVGWCFKYDREKATRIPYFSGMFQDLLMHPTVREYQKNINWANSSKMVVGEVPLLGEASAAKIKDALGLSPEMLAKFLKLMKSAMPDSVRVTSAPLKNIKDIDFDANNDLYRDFTKSMIANSGSNTNLLYAGDVKPNAAETQFSLNTDEQLMTSIYFQFNQFMNYQVNRFTNKYKFVCRFEGTNFPTDRDSRLSRQKDLMNLGIVLPQKVAAAIGMSPFEFQRQLDEARAMGWTDNLTPIVPSSQISADDDVGRPKKDSGELGETGQETRDSGGNIGRGGKTESTI